MKKRVLPITSLFDLGVDSKILVTMMDVVKAMVSLEGNNSIFNNTSPSISTIAHKSPSLYTTWHALHQRQKSINPKHETTHIEGLPTGWFDGAA
jgi:hypothetical protein